MSPNLLHVLGAALFSLLILASGFWLTRLGKPYNQVLFNVHKLVALAAVILFGITLFQANKANTLDVVQIILSVVTGLVFLSLFVTGALVSIDKPMPRVIFTLHHITPYLALLCAAASLYIVVR